MEVLLKQQLSQGELIANFTANTQKTGRQNQTRGFLEGRRQLLQKYWNSFDEKHNEIISYPESKDCEYIKRNYFVDIEVIYTDALGKLLDALDAITIPPQTPPNSQGDQGQSHQAIYNSNVKLPSIVIPKFSGDYSTWTSFHDLFESLIVKNASLSNVNKLHHLKSCLTGEAELVLRKYAIEETNFEPAWKHLKLRFANKRLLAHSHFSKLLSQSRVQIANASAIRRLHDISSEAITSLHTLLDENERFDNIVIYLLSQKLDSSTVHAWEDSIKDEEDFPKLETFLLFLETQCRMEDLASSTCKQFSNDAEKRKKDSLRSLKAFNSNKSIVQCTHCGKANHSIYKCYKFKALSAAERLNLVRNNDWCTRCLSAEHQTPVCPRTWLCSKCNGIHNNLLHQSVSDSNSSSNRFELNLTPPAQTNGNTKSIVSNNLSSQQDAILQIHHALNFQNSKTLLGTAQVLITSSYGKVYKFRALIDPGSDSCLISRSAVSLLKLPLQKFNTHVTALGGTSVAKSSQIINCTIRSIHDENSTIAINAVIMPNLTTARPPSILQTTSWDHFKHLPLADPEYFKTDKIDLILGADSYFDLFMPDIRKGPRGSPTAQKTRLGYVLFGQIFNFPEYIENSREITTCFSESDICERLRMFWELEDVGNIHTPSQEEEYCERHYQLTHRRKPDGRYVVDLPFKSTENNMPIFCESKAQALNRLSQVERRLHKNSELKTQYFAFMDEYLNLGHMNIVENSSPENSACYYLPHHAIVRPSHTTTKLRVVFDASAKDSSGKSLNDTLHVGPTIQQDLLSILLRWRKHKIALTADAEKMYRQIEININQRSYQRILWRGQNEQILEYELSTVTYGTACAPFLAVRTIHQLAFDEKHNCPLAAEKTLSDMYVDDLITGCDSIEEAQNLQFETVDLFRRGGFNLRKWSSNSDEVLSKIPQSKQQSNALDICKDDVIKTLGIFWHPAVDEFQFVINLSDIPIKITKRNLLSDVSKIFDPLGFLAPVVISAKILFQSLWLRGLSWDDELPYDILQEWLSLRSKLRLLSSIKIPRWLGTTTFNTAIEFHGFCDASQKAYAAVIYCRTEVNGLVTVHMLTSKSRVAPIKRVSLPNLELCGAVLLAKLVSKVKLSMSINASITTWTDSTIVLDWIRSNKHKQVFVANRISTIHEHIQPEQWKHIRSKDNPADVASRGICPTLLESHSLWWHGPEWLQKPHADWPKQIKHEKPNPPTDITVAISHLDSEFSTIIEKYSSLKKLVRIIAFCLRFAQNCRKKLKSKNTKYLSAEEHRNSLAQLILYVQGNTYPNEIHLLKKSNSVANSKIGSLCPFICKDGFIRVGGRLQKANITYNQKHPILLPSNNHLTKLIITKVHTETLHGGLKLTLATLRQNYWIPNARTAIRKIIHHCVKCHRYSTRTREQMMSALPAARVNESRVFEHTGIDYAGPFNLRISKHRGRGTYKGFVAIFVCLATKAIHLEVASDLSTKTFLAAFKRFISRRGPCSNIYSDNGTNFVGANREMQSMFDQTMSEISNKAAEMLAINGTTWHFIPARSPHFGGLWEAAVKSFKFHLRRIIDNATLTYEEFGTLLTEIEASLNSRPLCQISSDPNDIEALTPGHFLTGAPLNAMPEPSLLNTRENLLNRWQLLTKMHQDFWQIWSKEYLSEMQQRPKKWRTPRENLQVGDLVIIKEECLPPSNWILARITQTHSGDDGLIRVVTLKHRNGETKRAVNKVCRVPVDRH